MLFTLKETVQWLGMTLFELWVHLISLLLFTIFLSLKLQGVWDASWWVVFTPLFTCDGLNTYFATIVFIRLYLDRDFRVAALRLFWSGLLLALIFVFKMLLCKRLEGEADISYSLIMSPLFVMLQVLVIRACQVQGTNDSSIVSKCSTAAQGYFQDDFLQIFASKTARRAPLINRGYYIRARVIDDILKKFLSVHHDEKKQIISLGAGFDSAFFRLHASGHLADTTFHEVDFPDVVRRKAAIIRSNAKLREQLSDEVYENPDSKSGIRLTSANYHLLGLDLTNLPLLEQCLNQTAIDCQLPTLLLSECVLTYMEVTSSNAIIQWASTSFPNAVFVTYEQIHPNDPFGMVMRKHFEKLNSPLKAIQTYPTIKAQQERFQALGWRRTSAIDMNNYYNNRLSLAERKRVECLEPFDEFEEWHCKCSHYAVIAACNGACVDMATFIRQDKQIASSEDNPNHTLEDPLPTPLQTRSLASTPSSTLRRFGHASALVSPDKVIVSGGFGEAGTKHARLSDIVIINLKTGSWDVVPASSKTHELEPQMHHTMTAISGGKRWFLFGGRSSPTRPISSAFIVTLNAEQQGTLPGDNGGQNWQHVAGEMSSGDPCIQESHAQATHTMRSLQDLKFSSEACNRDDVAKIEDGTKLNLQRNAERARYFEDGCELKCSPTTAANTTNTASTCDNIHRSEGPHDDRVEESAVNCDRAEDCSPSTCLEDKSQTDIKVSPVYFHPEKTVSEDGCPLSHTMDKTNGCCSNGCESSLQTDASNSDSFGSNGLQSTTGNRWRNSASHNETTPVTENSNISSSHENLRNSEIKSPQKRNACRELHSNGTGCPYPAETEIFSYSSRRIETYGCDVPKPRWRHSALHAVVNGKECVVIYGGRGVGEDVLGDCWSFDVGQLTWEKLHITGDRPPASHSHTASLWQDTRMVIAGGLGPNLRPLNSVYAIDLETLRSQEITLTPTLPPRYSHTAHVVGNSLLLVGGVSPLGAYCYTVAVIDLLILTWNLYSFPTHDVERPLMIHNHTSELLSETNIVILGGGGNCFSFGTHLNNSPVEIRVPL